MNVKTLRVWLAYSYKIKIRSITGLDRRTALSSPYVLGQDIAVRNGNDIEAVALTRKLHMWRSRLEISRKKNSLEKYLTESRSNG